MAETNQHIPEDIALTDVDRLLSLLVDGEATDVERAQFEQRAAGDSELWRRLADAQEAAAALQRDVTAQLGRAVDMELDVVQLSADEPVRTLRGPWIAAAVGWAAVLVLAVLWFAAPEGSPAIDGATPIDKPMDEPVITYDGALNLYLEAPWVRGQMQPHLTEIESLPDGTKRYWILRRIEEYIDLPPDGTLPVDAGNNLQVEPATLRDDQPIDTAENDS